MLGSWVRAPCESRKNYASLAQLVEHDTLNVGVQGSSPWGSTTQVLYINIASLAQLVEHDTLNVGVQGSSPWGSTKIVLYSLLKYDESVFEITQRPIWFFRVR